MNDEYIKKIADKREALGVSQLSSDSKNYSKDTKLLCEEEAKKSNNN